MEKPTAQREKILFLLGKLGGLNAENVTRVHQRTQVPEADIWGAGTFYSLLKNPGRHIRACNGLSCRLRGADAQIERLRRGGSKVEAVSCLGQCDRAPAALDENFQVIGFDEAPRGVSPEHPDLPINLGGPMELSFSALKQARQTTPEALLQIIEDAGLQGRGGAGFPAHFKWRSLLEQEEKERYVVCNADEGEPGTFKDRECMLRRPEKVLEGLAIAAHAIGARDIYIYIRGEFKAELDRLKETLDRAGSALAAFQWFFHVGSGAYICGEETALLESLEGKRGMPRLKPPFPTESGFRGKPTLMHNVETIACIPYIVLNGGKRFREHGRTEAGSKLYCISGHVNRPGVYELPLGAHLDELVIAAGGYDGEPLAFSPGGASSGFLPMTQRRLPLDYKNLAEAGSMLGSAGVVVLNDTVDMARAAAWQLQFFEEESCGQCAPCRIGTRYLHRQLGKFLAQGDPGKLLFLEEIGWEMEEGSICGLGMVAAKPLQTARQYWPEAFARRTAEERP